VGPNILLHFNNIARLRQTHSFIVKSFQQMRATKYCVLPPWQQTSVGRTYQSRIVIFQKSLAFKTFSLQDQSCTLFAPLWIAIAIHAQFDIKVLFQTRGIVLDYTVERAENLDYIILDLARTVAWFASPGNFKRLFWDTFAFCPVMAASTRLQVLGKFVLWDLVT
jgi:hypothetical protein